MRISFRDLNEASVHPRAFIGKLNGQKGQPQIFSYSYYNVLLNTIFHFHNHYDNLKHAELYLTEKLASFKSEKRKEEISDQFHWYAQDCLNKGLTTFEVRQNIRILPGIDLKTNITISGQISRIDLEPKGGYTAWIFRNRNPENWVGEFSMPLIQYELANNILRVPDNEVHMGIYSFTEQVIERHCYSSLELQEARKNLEQLLKSLGFA